MAEDWDLFAVVRSCSSAAATATSTTAAAAAAESRKGETLACLASLTFEEEADPFSFPNLAQPSNNGFLQDSYRPFLSNPSPTTSSTSAKNPSSASSVGEFSGRRNQPPPPTTTMGISPPSIPTSNPVFVFGQSRNQQKPQHVQQQKQLIRRQPTVQPPEVQTPTAAIALPLRSMHSQGPKSRKRKNLQKRTVCHVTADNLSADPWAWRKYGQKPIKGSPHPRNYYRCSSLKGCSARKQVEQSNLDPNIFIVTYTGDHTHPKPTHRNSLAGSTRNKASTAQKSSAEKTPASETAADAPGFSALSSTSVCPTTPLSTPQEGAEAVQDAGVENETGGANDAEMVAGESDDDDLLIPNIQMDEDLLKGLNELTGSGGGGSSSSSGFGQSPPFENGFSWASTSSGTIAGDGC